MPQLHNFRGAKMEEMGGGEVGRENQEEGKEEPSRRREGEAESHHLQCCAVFLSPYTFLLSKSCCLPQIRVTPHISAWWHVGSEPAKNSMVKSWWKKKMTTELFSGPRHADIWRPGLVRSLKIETTTAVVFRVGTNFMEYFYASQILQAALAPGKFKLCSLIPVLQGTTYIAPWCQGRLFVTSDKTPDNDVLNELEENV